MFISLGKEIASYLWFWTG